MPTKRPDETALAFALAFALLVAPLPAAAQAPAPSPAVERDAAGAPPRAPELEEGAGEAAAEAPAAEPERAAPPRPVSADGLRLPAPRSSRHEISTPEGVLAFEARAGVLTLSADDGREEADVAYVLYALPEADPATRPVTFVVNGGPGAASAYLHLGAMGPFVVRFGEGEIIPSAAPELVDNPDTWLPFTDLVFVDPVGTGFSRLVAPSDALRDRYLSVGGDIQALARFVARWSRDNGRGPSPKYFVGESYGGFRGPLLADALQESHGIALAGLVLVSPVLDFGWREGAAARPLPRVALLPSVAAAAMERAGGIDRAALAEVEAYAIGDYVSDLLAGLSDEAAVERLVANVARVTGLPEEVARRAAGRLDARLVARELHRAEGRVASLYDAGVTIPDPAPTSAFPRYRDPVLDALTPPLTAAALRLYRERLGWAPERDYLLLNGGVARAWSYGSSRSAPEALEELASALALDRTLGVLVVHGLTDLVTPYFESELILRQLPPALEARVRRENFPGGHMFYTRPESRRAFRDAARALY